MQNEGGMSGPAQNQDFYKQPSLMSKSKSMIIPQTAPNVSSGILSSFKDLMGIRKHDPPEISVTTSANLRSVEDSGSSTLSAKCSTVAS
jgi:hypothetical protein